MLLFCLSKLLFCSSKLIFLVAVSCSLWMRMWLGCMDGDFVPRSFVIGARTIMAIMAMDGEFLVRWIQRKQTGGQNGWWRIDFQDSFINNNNNNCNNKHNKDKNYHNNKNTNNNSMKGKISKNNNNIKKIRTSASSSKSTTTTRRIKTRTTKQ